MTERLSELMQRAADGLAVPPAPSAEVLRHGRSVRRHRTYAVGAGAVAAVVVVSGIGMAVARGDGGAGGDSRPDRQDQVVADPASGLTGPVFSIGTTVYLDGGARTATIDDKAIKSMYYTSAGVVVRHGNNNYSDGGGPMRFSLVAPDGAVSRLGVTFEETVPSTDPDQPYLAYAEKVGGVVQVVVLDVRDGSEAARVPVPGAKHWAGWTAPPVSLDGDVVYVGTRDAVWSVAWRTGEVSETGQVPQGYPEVHGGHSVVYDGDQMSVVDVSDGATVAAADKKEYLRLSPDGRYAIARGSGAARIFDLADGGARTLDGLDPDGSIGWSPDDSVFTLTGSELTTCPAATGDCTTTTLTLPTTTATNESEDDFSDAVRLGGETYES